MTLSDLAGYKFEPTTFAYTERDAILYALGVGTASNPLDMDALQFVYENHPGGFKVLPTFAATFAHDMMLQLFEIPGLTFEPMMLLHGEQYTEVKRPLPAAATLTNQGRLAAVYDKGSGALLLIEVTSDDADGAAVAFNRYSFFVRGLGGFGGERGPSGARHATPERTPDAVHEERIPPDQALLYRLSGDRNPLHIDPRMAAVGGFERPILHGLCTFGFAVRALLRRFAGDGVARFNSVQVRFTHHVFPGETLRIEMWDTGDGRVLFRCLVLERDAEVLSNALLTLDDKEA